MTVIHTAHYKDKRVDKAQILGSRQNRDKNLAVARPHRAALKERRGHSLWELWVYQRPLLTAAARDLAG